MTGLVVVKVGGGTVADARALSAVAHDVAALSRRGERVLMVHGGGPQATALQRALGQTPNVVGGRRITDADALNVMKMVVAGRLNVDLCSALLGAGARPVGLHGASSTVIEGRKRPPRIVSGCGPDPIDFGEVGDVVGFNEPLLNLLLAEGYVPALACLASTPEGRPLNINGDIVANHVAEALGATHLVLVTGAPGVLLDRDDPESRLPKLTVAEAAGYIEAGVVTDGMIPKLEESMRLLRTGSVGVVHIVGPLTAGQLLQEIDAPGTVGTALVP